MVRIMQTLRRRLKAKAASRSSRRWSRSRSSPSARSRSPRRCFRAEHHRSVASEALLPRRRRPADGGGAGPQLRQPGLVRQHGAPALVRRRQPRLLGGPERARRTTPTAAAPWGAEPIVRVAGASPALAALPEPPDRRRDDLRGLPLRDLVRLAAGRDGCASDQADGNSDGVERCERAGREARHRRRRLERRTRSRITSLSESSLFSDGQIIYKHRRRTRRPRWAARPPPCRDKTVTFTANASDTDGTIASVTWDFGDGNSGTGTTVDAYVRELPDVHRREHRHRQRGSVASNSAAGCTVTTVSPVWRKRWSRRDGVRSTADVTLHELDDGDAVTREDRRRAQPGNDVLSNDNSTWLGPYAFATSYTWTMTSGDGTKTVYARFYNSSGYTARSRATRSRLDTVAPGTPTSFAQDGTTISRREHDDHFTWGAGRRDRPGRLSRLQATDHVDGRVCSLVCDTISTTCSDTHKKTDTYEYYIVAYDLATNVSAGSTPHLTG